MPKQYLILYFIIILIPSCTKVINVNIKDVEKKYVIEGIIADYKGSCKVNISQTINFSDSNKFIGVENAIVTIADNGKSPILLTGSGGVYRSDLAGIPGHTYKLQVDVNGQTFTATSVMPKKVKFDSLLISERLFLGKIRKMAAVKFQDPAGIYNAYRFIQYVDGRKENTIFALDDNLIDGRSIFYELLIFNDDKYTLLPEDQLRVEMRCIDRNNYLYWFSLTQGALGQNQSASPANPVSNIQGGALGYFSANTFDVKLMAIK